MRCAVLALLAAFTAVATVSAHSPPEAERSYRNSWAVEVDGGLRSADALARAYGFVNRGPVMSEYVPSIIMFACNQLRCSITVITDIVVKYLRNNNSTMDSVYYPCVAPIIIIITIGTAPARADR